MPIKLNGSTSGSVELDVPAVVSGGNVSLTLPTGAGGANQFLKNSNTAGTLEYASIAAADMPAGSILQRQFTTSYTEVQVAQQSHKTIFSSSTFNAKRANSRIHITCHLAHGKRAGGEHQFSVRLLRNGTLVTAHLSSASGVNYDVIRHNQTDLHTFTSFHFYDEPNSTGNITYTIQAVRPNAGYPTVYFNFASNNPAGSTMIIDEIAQ